MKRNTVTFYNHSLELGDFLHEIIYTNDMDMLVGGKVVTNKNKIIRLIDYWGGDFWHLAGLFPDRTIRKYSEFQYASFESIEDIDSTIGQISNDYEWTIFPWGPPGEFRLICIYNKDGFFERINNPSILSEMSKYEVSEYEFCEQIPFHSLLVHERPDHIGKMLWQLYDLEITRPIIATFDIARHDIRGYSDYRSLKPDFVEVGEVNGIDGDKYHLYKPDNVCAFSELCGCLYGMELDDVNDFIVFPGNSDHESIERYLQNLPQHPRSLCSCHKESIRMFEWVYMVDVGDCQTQTWLVSRNGLKTREVKRFANSGLYMMLAF